MLHRAVLCHDPDAARKRREKAQKSARVECWAEPAGTAAMAGRDLPPAQVLAADKHAAAARALKAARAEGTLEQLRARVFLALLSGRPLYTLLPGQDQDDGQPGPALASPPAATMRTARAVPAQTARTPILPAAATTTAAATTAAATQTMTAPAMTAPAAMAGAPGGQDPARSTAGRAPACRAAGRDSRPG